MTSRIPAGARPVLLCAAVAAALAALMWLPVSHEAAEPPPHPGADPVLVGDPSPFHHRPAPQTLASVE